jgi:hypothetical protein
LGTPLSTRSRKLSSRCPAVSSSTASRLTAGARPGSGGSGPAGAAGLDRSAELARDPGALRALGPPRGRILGRSTFVLQVLDSPGSLPGPGGEGGRGWQGPRWGRAGRQGLMQRPGACRAVPRAVARGGLAGLGGRDTTDENRSASGRSTDERFTGAAARPSSACRCAPPQGLRQPRSMIASILPSCFVQPPGLAPVRPARHAARTAPGAAGPGKGARELPRRACAHAPTPQH